LEGSVAHTNLYDLILYYITESVPFGTVGYSSVEASLIPLAIDNDTFHASELISGDNPLEELKPTNPPLRKIG